MARKKATTVGAGGPVKTPEECGFVMTDEVRLVALERIIDNHYQRTGVVLRPVVLMGRVPGAGLAMIETVLAAMREAGRIPAEDTQDEAPSL